MTASYAPDMDWAERVARLRQWSRGGERAPHKPLLLLYALGRYQRSGGEPIIFSEAEAELGRLLREFGPPRRTSPSYPFHHLAADGLWTVSTPAGGGSPGDSGAALRKAKAAGRLVPDLIHSLDVNPELLPQLAHTLLDTNFEPSLHGDICAAVGLDLEAAEDRVGDTRFKSPRGRRDPEFRRQVLVAYENMCAFCGYDGMLDGWMVGLEAAHVRWWTHDGPNEMDNGLCLCALHHKLFDKGVLGITEDNKLTVSVHFVGHGSAAELLVKSLSGQVVDPPQKAFPPVAADHAAWHAREVFRGPARVS